VLKKGKKCFCIVLSTYTINKRLPEPLQLLVEMISIKSEEIKMVADIGSSVGAPPMGRGEVAEF